MMDDRMDHTIDDAAAEYHRPPAAPREEMWRRIEAARRAGGQPTVLPFHRRARRFALPIGIAALLALAFGLGRVTVDESGPTAPIAVTEPGRPASSDAGTASPDSSAPSMDAAAPADLAATDADLAVTDPAGPGVRQPPRREGARAPSQLAAEPAGEHVTEPSNRPATDPDRRSSEPTAALALAARQHLAQAETFLSLFRASINSGQRVEPVVPATARYLLASNRLLIDSRAAGDPAMRRLLGDVELVLAQIAQMPADTADTTDERLITDGIEQRDLLLRIRAAAGDAASAPYQGVL